MFENFTFGTCLQAQTPFCRDDLSTSPTDTSFLFSPLTPNPVPEQPGQQPFDDITRQFSQHTLHLEDDEAVQSSTWSDSMFAEFSDAELTYLSTTRGLKGICLSLPNIPLPQSNLLCRRAQRKRQTQPQTSPTHTRDIDSLVEDMISSNSQCTLRESSSKTSISTPSPSTAGFTITKSEAFVLEPSEAGIQSDSPASYYEDEGFVDMDDAEEMSLRRAGMLGGVRKHNQYVRYRASAGGGIFPSVERPRLGQWRVQRMRKPRLPARKVEEGA